MTYPILADFGLIIALTYIGLNLLAGLGLRILKPRAHQHRLCRLTARLSAPLAGLFLLLACSQSSSAFLGLVLTPTTSILFALAIFIGGAVLGFSIRYLDGDPRQMKFLADMHLTLGFIGLFMLADSLWLFAASWILISLSLHRLLLVFPERAGARRAALKKFALARGSDAALVAALVLVGQTLHVSSLSAVAAALQAQPGVSPELGAAALLLILAAILKSAQFPFHGWLVEVMETPTPVSALLHAGVVNAGGVLLIRTSALIVHNEASLWLLAVTGALSVVTGSLAAMHQGSIKSALAWSTVAQMGFMLLQCALGAFSAALFHIIAHALYKANAFLSAGELSKTPSLSPEASGRSRVAIFALSAAVIIWLVASVAPAGAVLSAAVLALALMQIDLRNKVAATAAALMLATGLIVWRSLFDLPFGGLDIAARPERLWFGLAVLMLLAALQVLLSAKPDAPASKALKLHARNGFYINALINRSLGQ